jgi:hypothetical protein
VRTYAPIVISVQEIQLRQSRQFSAPVIRVAMTAITAQSSLSSESPMRHSGGPLRQRKRLFLESTEIEPLRFVWRGIPAIACGCAAQNKMLNEK